LRLRRLLFSTVAAGSIALGAIGASGCGAGPCGAIPTNSLTGSVGEPGLFDIQVDSVSAREPDPHTLVLEFMHGRDIVTKVVADVSTFMKGAEIPLVSGDVYRITNPETDFPKTIAMGSLQISSDLVVGMNVDACFNVTFQDMMGMDTIMRTLNGAISTSLGGP
jgi:hypothetical protein